MLRNFLAITAAFIFLTGCDVDLFGLDRKKLGGGYSLLLSEVDDECALVPPHQNGGTLVAEVGWQKPLILTRSDGFKTWDVIDTTTHKQTTISDEQRKTDTAYHNIAVYGAGDAWKRLKHYRSLW
jgi:hypothetical protein